MPVPSSTKLLQETLDLLQKTYGRPKPQQVTNPLELILYENVAYLLNDRRREAAFKALRERVGLLPKKILAAPLDSLLGIAKLGGMHPEERVKRLRRIAQIALNDCQGDLKNHLQVPLPQAKRLLKKFPAIGDPGAEKILLFSRSYPILALDSNGLRVLLRIGFGQELRSYSSTYRSVREAVKDQLREDYSWLIQTHQLLRRHGQEICRRSQPLCMSCPLTNHCRFYLRGRTKT